MLHYSCVCSVGKSAVKCLVKVWNYAVLCNGWILFFDDVLVQSFVNMTVAVTDHAASSEEEFKPDTDKSDDDVDDDDDDDDELSVVESTSGSSPEESETETPDKVFPHLVIRHNIGSMDCNAL